MFMKEENGLWSDPQAAPFSRGNIQAPVFSPDGRRLYFQAVWPNGQGSLDIWYVEKTDSGWGPPQNPGPPLNTEKLESQPSLAANGNLYFTGTMDSVEMGRGIYMAKFAESRYEKPIALGYPINTEFIDYTPFIAPDESFLLFSSSRPSREEKDLKLYVSFRNKQGTWDIPINLSAKLALKSSARFPFLSPDGKYLFFLSEGKIYWVGSDIIRKDEKIK